MTVEGVTPAIIIVGANALKDTYAIGFRNIWLSALCFIVLAGVGMIHPHATSFHFTNI